MSEPRVWGVACHLCARCGGVLGSRATEPPTLSLRASCSERRCLQLVGRDPQLGPTSPAVRYFFSESIFFLSEYKALAKVRRLRVRVAKTWSETAYVPHAKGAFKTAARATQPCAEPPMLHPRRPLRAMAIAYQRAATERESTARSLAAHFARHRSTATRRGAGLGKSSATAEPLVPSRAAPRVAVERNGRRGGALDTNIVITRDDDSRASLRTPRWASPHAHTDAKRVPALTPASLHPTSPKYHLASHPRAATGLDRDVNAHVHGAHARGTRRHGERRRWWH